MQIHRLTFHLIFDSDKNKHEIHFAKYDNMPQLHHSTSPSATVQMTQNLGQFQKQIRKF